MTAVRLYPGLAALLFILSLNMAGCGKKGDPRPTMLHRPPAITDLSAQEGAAAAELRWSLSQKVQSGWTFRILRSESVDSEAFCPGCPQTYRLQKELKPDDGRLQRTGENSFRYDDADLRPGHVYLYRVTVCLPAGSCAAESNSAGPVRSGR
jgi:hypothetical protein